MHLSSFQIKEFMLGFPLISEYMSATRASEQNIRNTMIWRDIQISSFSKQLYVKGSPPTGLHFGPKRDYITGSLFKQAGYKIVICVLHYIVIE